MPRLAVALLLALAAACAVSALPRDNTEQLRESLRQHGRTLKQPKSAFSSASGGQSASASASVGPQGAQTSQQATGGNAQVQGISQVGERVDVCQRGPADSAACQTLTPADRSTACTDIAPDVRFTCAEQAKFGKCDADFIYLYSFCLASCNRCGSNCADVAPTGVACALDQCNGTAIASGPYCLKTCGRCSTV